MSNGTAILASALHPVGLAKPGRPALATRTVALFVFLKLALHLGAVATTPYEIHRDEFLYLAMGEHLRLWAMDFPPAIAILAKMARFVLGDTLFAIRLFPALAGALVLVFAALLARELGGGRIAQFFAMLGVLSAPVFMRPAALFQPVVFDQLCWTAGFFALSRIVQEPRSPRWWLLLGAACGLGLLTKFSILFFGCSVFIGLLASPQRTAFLTRWPWLTVLIAVAIGSPSFIGQFVLDFPILIHMKDLREAQLHRITPAEFLTGQIWMVGPALLVALAGFAALFSRALLARFRVIGISCGVAFLILLFLQGKPYYIAPIYPALLAAGGVALAQAPGGLGRALRTGSAAVLTLWGVLVLPFGLPILPPALMAKYAAGFGIKAATTTNRGTSLPLPQDYADMLGWEDQVKAVASVFKILSREQQEQAWLVGDNYGQAGALEFYGPQHGLPRRIMLPQNFLLWPAQPGCQIVVTVGARPEDVAVFFKSVRVGGRYDHPWMVEEERNVPICIGETPIRDLLEAWKRGD